MIAKSFGKEDVFNPMSLFNTIGLEIESIIEDHKKSKSDLLKMLGWAAYASKERVKKKEIDIISDFLELGDELNSFIQNFQDEYAEKKKESAKSYKESLQNFRQLKPVLPLLKNEFLNGIDVLEDITDFFGKESEDEIFADIRNNAALYRLKANSDVDDICLSALLRRGLLDFEKNNLPNYDEKGLMGWIESKVWEDKIEDVAYFKKLPEILCQYGVFLSFSPFLSKTIYGCVRWIDEKPLIQITDRDKDLASCWFTLFHEFGHIINHHNDDVFDGAINEKKTKISKKERDANKFANGYLFNGDELRKEVFAGKQRHNAIKLAKKHNVHQLFAEYWLRKGGIVNERKISIQF